MARAGGYYGAIDDDDDDDEHQYDVKCDVMIIFGASCCSVVFFVGTVVLYGHGVRWRARIVVRSRRMRDDERRG